ncbi:hypothetical protein [Conchiformibius kuhniae]|uniref:Uncharacterized protein n=1 Tax=Conchiformibius kuhniae TaxID=211502 RepID=A0A8T9MVY3_9NEIS|nr:hypothetical protein [Conchiformibius kuhniae]UOP05331.1 hypothetical protein LVJ77_03800 [Conchiformibius kuhniae]
MKLIKPFYGVPDGAFYPVHYQKGDECPPELEEAAREAGCLKDGKKSKSDMPPAPNTPPADESTPPADNNGNNTNNPPAENNGNGENPPADGT